MEAPKITKTLPYDIKNTLPKKMPPELYGWFKYGFSKPMKSTEKPTLILTLGFIISDKQMKKISGSYELKFEYTTQPDYNPMQICQVFHWSAEIGVEDFKKKFIEEGFIGYPLQKVVAPTFEQAFPVLKELYYPPDISEN